jgi:hypothetical protein
MNFDNLMNNACKILQALLGKGVNNERYLLFKTSPFIYCRLVFSIQACRSFAVALPVTFCG